MAAQRSVRWGSKVLRLGDILIATGSPPVTPQIEGLPEVSYLTSDLLTTDRAAPRLSNHGGGTEARGDLSLQGPRQGRLLRGGADGSPRLLSGSMLADVGHWLIQTGLLA